MFALQTTTSPLPPSSSLPHVACIISKNVYIPPQVTGFNQMLADPHLAISLIGTPEWCNNPADPDDGHDLRDITDFITESSNTTVGVVTSVVHPIRRHVTGSQISRVRKMSAHDRNQATCSFCSDCANEKQRELETSTPQNENPCCIWVLRFPLTSVCWVQSYCSSWERLPLA